MVSFWKREGAMYGERIRELRKIMKMTQKQLAEKLGIRQNDVSSYELEQHEPSIATILKLCEMFDVSADFLLGRTDF